MQHQDETKREADDPEHRRRWEGRAGRRDLGQRPPRDELGFDPYDDVPGTHRGPGYTGGGGPGTGPDFRDYARPDWHWESQRVRKHYSNIFDEERGRPRSSFRGTGPKGYVRSDERIHEDVCERLAESHELDPSEVEVAVAEGRVTLSGTVDSRWAKRYAEDLAYGVRGVDDVQNLLTVEKRGEQQRGAAAERGNGQRGIRTAPAQPSSRT